MVDEPSVVWPRVCACGESWSEAEWSELPSDGLYFAGSDGWMELRTCVCGARLTIPCAPPPSVPTRVSDT